MDPYNRLQALIRNPTYLEDFQKLGAGKINEDHFLEKWGLTLPVEPAKVQGTTADDIFQSARLVFRDLEGWPVSVIKAAEEQSTRGKTSIEGEEVELTEIDITPHLREGRYLCLEVDLKAKQEEIEKAIKAWITYYLPCIEKGTARNRQGLFDPWEIYDLRGQGMNLSQIMKEKFNTNKNPSYDAEAKSRYEQIRNAYNKAVRMIEKVKPSISSIQK